MSRLGCKCGNALSNVNSPSENILYVWPEELIQKVTQSAADMSAFDFSTTIGDCDYEVWYCQNCERVAVVGVKERRVRAYYNRVESGETVPDVSGWKVFYEISEMDFDRIIEQNFEIKISDVAQNCLRLWLSPDQRQVCIETLEGTNQLIYILEEIVPVKAVL